MSFLDTALSTIHSSNKLVLVACPTIAVGTLSIGSRVMLGALSICCNKMASIVEIIDLEMGQDIKSTGDLLMFYAKKNFNLELKATVGLTAIVVGGIWVSTFFEQPKASTLNNLKSFQNSSNNPLQYQSLQCPSINKTPIRIQKPSLPNLGGNISGVIDWLGDALGSMNHTLKKLSYWIFSKI